MLDKRDIFCIFVVQFKPYYVCELSKDNKEHQNKGVREFKKLTSFLIGSPGRFGLQRTPYSHIKTITKMQSKKENQPSGSSQIRTIADCNYGSFENLTNSLRSRTKEDLINDFIVLMKQRDVAYRFIKLNGLSDEFNRLKIIVSEASVCQN